MIYLKNSNTFYYLFLKFDHIVQTDQNYQYKSNFYTNIKWSKILYSYIELKHMNIISLIDWWLFNVQLQIFNAYSVQEQYLKTIQKWGRDWDNRGTTFDKLCMDDKIVFCIGCNAPKHYRNLLKLYLTYMERRDDGIFLVLCLLSNNACASGLSILDYTYGFLKR